MSGETAEFAIAYSKALMARQYLIDHADWYKSPEQIDAACRNWLRARIALHWARTPILSIACPSLVFPALSQPRGGR